MTAITAITAQNTLGVSAVEFTPPSMIIAQVRAVAQDIGVDAVKIGMLGNADTIAAVDEALDLLAPGTPVVLDPVMVAESGAELLAPAAREALIERLLPRATVLTPNVPEARALTGATRDDSPEALVRAVHAMSPAVIVVTGGHRDQPVDLYFDGERLEALGGPRYAGGAAHGSGCTHSSTLAAQLARGASALEAARIAKAVAAEAVHRGLRDLGGGAGPVAALPAGAADRGPEPSGIIGER